jgi:hypothetical protein
MDLLKKRLREGLGDSSVTFRFVVEDTDPGKRQQLLLGSTDEEQDLLVVQAKTLVWQVVIEASCKEAALRLNCQLYLYFATVLGYQDRVDEELLKERLVESHHGRRPIAMEIMEASTNQSNDFLLNTIESDTTSQQQLLQVIRLELAETSKAEELTGYMSGTIPPFAHSTPMVLLIEETLLDNHDNHRNNNTTYRRRIVSTGSGSFRHSLWLPMEDWLPLTRALNAKVCVASFKSSNSSQRSELPTQNPAVPGSSGELEYSSTMMMRDATNMNKGKADTIAGDRVPEVRSWIVVTCPTHYTASYATIWHCLFCN